MKKSHLNLLDIILVGRPASRATRQTGGGTTSSRPTTKTLTYNLLYTFFFQLLFVINAFGQADYFQQAVDYKIEATLDDEKHLLSGTVKISYQNNSPSSLDKIYFHLWPNAYRSKKSAFAKQKVRTRELDFYFAKPENMGGYRELDFLSEGKKLNWKYDKDHDDIALIRLPSPLASGASFDFEIPFVLKVPDSYSRFGHVGTSYQMTQWYPKPAVFDKNGWHQMPYLNMGEFYSEFGNFDVTLTLPKNYVVAATGVLQTESEKEFLNDKLEETTRLIESGFSKDVYFPASAVKTKTIQFIANDVHDFAWFADKRFNVVKDKAVLDSGKEIDTWAFFTNEEADMWTKGAFYCKRAVLHYSNLVGDYPWPHATAVQSALSAGAGMEYPMITVIGQAGNAKALDRVITHEVGHNWFYGILATNERVSPWFDEGLNTYYENRYMRKFYTGDDEFDVPRFIKKDSKIGVNEVVCLYHDRRNLDQAPETHSDEMVSINYGLAAYVKPGRALRLLENYVGTTDYDNAMQTFYEQWKFKHPQPADFQNSLEKSLGKDLNWLFDGLLYSSDKSDFAIQNVEKIAEGYFVNIKNKGHLNTPFPVQGIKDGKVVSEKWVAPNSKESTINFPAGDYDKIAIDYENITLDIYRKNNFYKLSGALPKMEPIQFSFLGGIENPEKSRINFLPAIGYNHYDGAMLGLAFYSNPFPARKFEYNMVPVYGFNRQQLAGFGNFRYQSFPRKGIFHRIAFDVGIKSFGHGYSETYDQFSDYRKVAPKLTFDLRKSKAISPISHQISLRSVFINQAHIQGIDADQGIFEKVDNRFNVNELTYNFKDDHALKPGQASINVQQGKDFVKAFANIEKSYKFWKGKKRFTLRSFTGLMWHDLQTNEPPFIFFQTNGITSSSLFQTDYLFDEYLLGRSTRSGIFNNQIFDKDANLRTLATTIGSDKWMVGIGFQTGIPNPLPIEAYFDVAGYETPFNTEWDYSGGLALIVLRDIFEIYFPLIESDNITQSAFYDNNPGYFQRVSFKLDLNKLNPWDFINNIKI